MSFREYLTTKIAGSKNTNSLYVGKILGPEPSATPPITAIFNAPIVKIPQLETPILIPRIMTREQKPLVVDTTAWLGIYTLDDTKVKLIAKVTPKTILGTDKKNKDLNIEDLRVMVEEDGTLICGVTAATPDGIPLPGIFTMKYPFRPQDITPIEVMRDVPTGKNVVPLASDMVMYRRDTAGDRVVIIRRQEDGNWITVKEILFPHIANAKTKTRIGLNNAVMIPMPNGNFRWIIHENFMDEKTGLIEYAFRLAEFGLDNDGLPDLVSVDGQQFMRYKDVREMIDPYYTGREPDPNKHVIYNVGALWQYPPEGEPYLILPVTLYDKQIELFHLPLSLLQRPFTQSIRALKRLMGYPSFSVRPKWAFLR